MPMMLFLAQILFYVLLAYVTWTLDVAGQERFLPSQLIDQREYSLFTRRGYARKIMLSSLPDLTHSPAPLSCRIITCCALAASMLLHSIALLAVVQRSDQVTDSVVVSDFRGCALTAGSWITLFYHSHWPNRQMYDFTLTHFVLHFSVVSAYQLDFPTTPAFWIAFCAGAAPV